MEELTSAGWVRAHEIDDQVLAALALLPESKSMEMLDRVAKACCYEMSFAYIFEYEQISFQRHHFVDQAGSRLRNTEAHSSTSNPGSLLLNTLVKTYLSLSGPFDGPFDGVRGGRGNHAAAPQENDWDEERKERRRSRGGRGRGRKDEGVGKS